MQILKNQVSFTTKQFRKLTFPSWLRLCIEFLSLSCYHSSVLNAFMPTQITEVELTAGPAPWLKTIKSKVEIGHSPVVTDSSGTSVRDCKFPLENIPCPQIYPQPCCRDESVSPMLTHTFYSCWRDWGQVRGKSCCWIMSWYKWMNWRQCWQFFWRLGHFEWRTVVLSLMWTCGLLCRKSKPALYEFLTVPNKVMYLLWLFMVCLDIIHYSLRAYNG